MNEHVHVVCPRLQHDQPRAARAPRRGGQCGSCKEPLLPGHPFELTTANFDRHVDGQRPAAGRRFLGAVVRTVPDDGAGVRAGRRAARARTCGSPSSIPRAEPDIAARFGIRGIPTLIAFRNGREVARQSGAMDLPGLLGWIKANV